MPATPYSWQPTRQPILMSDWSASGEPTSGYTTVMSWASYQPVRYRGRSYGQKDVEFRQFIELAAQVPEASFEVALNPTEHVAWQSGVDSPRVTAAALLTGAKWNVIDAGQRARMSTAAALSSSTPGPSGASRKTVTSREGSDGSAAGPPATSRLAGRSLCRTPGSVR